ALGERLAATGYQVLQDPGVAGHEVDLAAERPEGYPQRIIAKFLPHLTPAAADALLAAARSLEADLALAVAPEADDEARKRFIATRAKWVAPDALGQIGL
ncbi:MAG TPA: hypothetical protein VI796_02525, partial [Candidatus Thermoplasmatota archaeon]|nr:hypothetical protein [Candidatus Thermoplasmatota archaeon]